MIETKFFRQNPLSQTHLTKNDKKKKRWVHVQTVVIVSVFVLLPWVLISIPGEVITKSGFPIRTKIRKHGWPAVQCWSEKYRIETTGTNRIPAIYFRLPPNNNKVPYNLNDPNNFENCNIDTLEINWGFEPPNQVKDYENEKRFWTDLNNWPFQFFEANAGCRRKFNFKGLAFNLLFLSVPVVLLAVFCEWKIRRSGSFLKISLKGLLVWTAIIAMMIAWAVGEYQRSKSHAEDLNYLAKISLRADQSIVAHNTLPEVVARLLDDRDSIPGLDFPLFRRSEKCKVILHTNYQWPETQDEKNDVWSNWNGINTPIDLTLSLTDSTFELISGFDEGKIERLTLYTISDIPQDFDIEVINRVTKGGIVQWAVPSTKQITDTGLSRLSLEHYQSLMTCPALRAILIRGLTEADALVMLDMADREFKLRLLVPIHSVSNETIEKLKSKFDLSGSSQFSD